RGLRFCPTWVESPHPYRSSRETVMEDSTRPCTRKMIRTTLLGAHSHKTAVGINVHCYLREGTYLARGRINGRQFGHRLGVSESDANLALRHLLSAIDNCSFVPGSQAGRRPLLATAPVPRMRLEEIALRYLEEKRRLKGRKTVQTYRGRLAPIL